MNNKTLLSSTSLTKVITIALFFYLVSIFSADAGAQYKVAPHDFSGFYISTGGVFNATQYIYRNENGGFESTIPTQYARKIQPFLVLGYERFWRNCYYMGTQLEHYFYNNKYSFNYHANSYHIKIYQNNLNLLLLTSGYLFSNIGLTKQNLLITVGFGGALAAYRYVAHDDPTYHYDQTKRSVSPVIRLGLEWKISRKISLFTHYTHIFQRTTYYNASHYASNYYHIKTSVDMLGMGIKWRFA